VPVSEWQAHRTGEPEDRVIEKEVNPNHDWRVDSNLRSRVSAVVWGKHIKPEEDHLIIIKH
jgi:hypothetical protein